MVTVIRGRLIARTESAQQNVQRGEEKKSKEIRQQISLRASIAYSKRDNEHSCLRTVLHTFYKSLSKRIAAMTY